MVRQDKFKQKNFLCPLASSLPPLCVVYLPYASAGIPAQPQKATFA